MKTETSFISFGKPLIGEEEKKAVLDVLSGPILVHGPKAKEFETDFAKYTGAKHAVSVSSCTAALHLSYMYLEIENGDEVIVPAQTHVATAHAVELCGAKPVFVDAEIKTGNIDIDQIESSINPKTRALSLVHFLGMPVNMDRIRAIAQKHKLFVVEDCALALGMTYKGKHAGTLGDVGCFSFYPVKHMTTSEGGMLITHRDDLAHSASRKKGFGVDRTHRERTVAGQYEVTMLGTNYRMSEIEAAMGIEQLKKLNAFVETRRLNYQYLSEKLKHIDEIEQFSTPEGSSYYCLSILLKPAIGSKRNALTEALKARGVGTSIYYPSPVPHFEYYRKKYGYSPETFPVAARISHTSIALPVGPHLNQDDMQTIYESLKEAVQEIRS